MEIIRNIDALLRVFYLHSLMLWLRSVLETNSPGIHVDIELHQAEKCMNFVKPHIFYFFCVPQNFMICMPDNNLCVYVCTNNL